jgi:hypothetical protein
MKFSSFFPAKKEILKLYRVCVCFAVSPKASLQDARRPPAAVKTLRPSAGFGTCVVGFCCDATLASVDQHDVFSFLLVDQVGRISTSTSCRSGGRAAAATLSRARNVCLSRWLKTQERERNWLLILATS